MKLHQQEAGGKLDTFSPRQEAKPPPSMHSSVSHRGLSDLGPPQKEAVKGLCLAQPLTPRPFPTLAPPAMEIQLTHGATEIQLATPLQLSLPQFPLGLQAAQPGHSAASASGRSSSSPDDDSEVSLTVVATDSAQLSARAAACAAALLPAQPRAGAGAEKGDGTATAAGRPQRGRKRAGGELERPVLDSGEILDAGERKRERNRQNAALSRARRQKYMADLEAKLVDMQAENSELRWRLGAQAEEIERLHDALASLTRWQSGMAPRSPAPVAGARSSPTQPSHAGNGREALLPAAVALQLAAPQHAQQVQRVQQAWQQPKEAPQPQEQVPQPPQRLPPFGVSHAAGAQQQPPSRRSTGLAAAESEANSQADGLAAAPAQAEVGSGQEAAGGGWGSWTVVSGSQPLSAPQAFFMPATGQPMYSVYSGAAQLPVGQQEQQPLHSLAAPQHAQDAQRAQHAQQGPAPARAPGPLQALQGSHSRPPLIVTAAPPPQLLLRAAVLAPSDAQEQPRTVEGTCCSQAGDLSGPHLATAVQQQEQQQQQQLQLQGRHWGSSTALATAAMESGRLGAGPADAAALEPHFCRHSAFAAPAAAGLRVPSPSRPAPSLKVRRVGWPAAAASEGAASAEVLPSAAVGGVGSQLRPQGSFGRATAAAAAAAAAAEEEAEAAAAEAAGAIRGQVLGGSAVAMAVGSGGAQVQRAMSVEVQGEQEDVAGALLQLAWQDGTPEAPWVVS